MLAFAPALALLTCALMAPSAIAFVLDRKPGRPVARAVALCGAAFTAAPLWHLFQAGATIGGALDRLQAPAVTGAAWLAGACGWALCEVLPVLLRVGSDLGHASRVTALETEARALREAWDLERKAE